MDAKPTPQEEAIAEAAVFKLRPAGDGERVTLFNAIVGAIVSARETRAVEALVETVHQEFELPAVGGRRIDCSNATFERRALIALKNEQEKVAPDNSLIALYCDAVRLTREYSDSMKGGIPVSGVSPQTDEEIARVESEKVEAVLRKLNPGAVFGLNVYHAILAAIRKAVALRVPAQPKWIAEHLADRLVKANLVHPDDRPRACSVIRKELNCRGGVPAQPK